MKKQKPKTVELHEAPELAPPPYSIEIESVVLGCMLIEPSLAKKGHELLTEETFYDPRHQRIFNQIGDMLRRGLEPDMVTVCEELRADPKFEEHGYADLIVKMTADVPTCGHFDSYVRMAQQKEAARRLSFLALELMRSTRDTEPEELVKGTMERVKEIEIRMERGQKRDFQVQGGQYASQVVELLENEKQRASAEILTGYSILDDVMWGLHRGEMVVVGARPGVGKSAFMINLAVNIMKNKRRVLYFSTEMSTYEQWKRLLSIKTQIPGQQFRRADFSSQEWQKLTDTLTQLHEENLFHVSDIASPTIEEIKEITHHVKPDVCIVDYLQRCTMPSAERDDLAIGEFMKALKTMSRVEECNVLLPSQFSREIERRTSKRPALSDFRDSGNIEQEADILMALWHKDAIVFDDLRLVDLTIMKNRHGRLGDMKINFQTQTLFMPEIVL